MTPFIATPADQARLKAEATSWLGTPYVTDGCVKGLGSSCSDLPWTILAALGFTSDAPPRRGTMQKSEILPLMERWLAARAGVHFERVATVAEVQPGDVMLFNAGIGHLSLVIDRNNLIHSWQRNGVHTVSYRQPQFAKRLVSLWRPVVAPVTPPTPS